MFFFFALDLLVPLLDQRKIFFGIHQILQLGFQLQLVGADNLLLLLQVFDHGILNRADLFRGFIHDRLYVVQRLIRVHDRGRIDILRLSAGIPDDLISLLFMLAFCLIATLLCQLILLHDLIDAGVEPVDQTKHFLFIYNDTILVIYLAPGDQHMDIT